MKKVWGKRFLLMRDNSFSNIGDKATNSINVIQIELIMKLYY